MSWLNCPANKDALSPLTTVFAETATEPLVTCKATCYQRASQSKKVPVLGPGMGLFAFASTAFFPGTPTHAQNSIKGEWERSAWQACQGVNVLKCSEKLSGFQGSWHRPGKVTKKGRVSWDIYLHLCFKSFEERLVNRTGQRKIWKSPHII